MCERELFVEMLFFFVVVIVIRVVVFIIYIIGFLFGFVDEMVVFKKWFVGEVFFVFGFVLVN